MHRMVPNFGDLPKEWIPTSKQYERFLLGCQTTCGCIHWHGQHSDHNEITERPPVYHRPSKRPPKGGIIVSGKLLKAVDASGKRGRISKKASGARFFFRGKKYFPRDISYIWFHGILIDTNSLKLENKCGNGKCIHPQHIYTIPNENGKGKEKEKGKGKEKSLPNQLVEQTTGKETSAIHGDRPAPSIGTSERNPCINGRLPPAPGIHSTRETPRIT